MSILERRNYYGLKAISGLMKESCHTIIHYFYNELLNYNMSYITICPHTPHPLCPRPQPSYHTRVYRQSQSPEKYPRCTLKRQPRTCYRYMNGNSRIRIP